MSKYIKNINNLKGGGLDIPFLICESDFMKVILPGDPVPASSSSSASASGSGSAPRSWDDIELPRDFIMAFLKNIFTKIGKNEKIEDVFHTANANQLASLKAAGRGKIFSFRISPVIDELEKNYRINPAKKDTLIDGLWVLQKKRTYIEIYDFLMDLSRNITILPVKEREQKRIQYDSITMNNEEERNELFNEDIKEIIVNTINEKRKKDNRKQLIKNNNEELDRIINIEKNQVKSALKKSNSKSISISNLKIIVTNILTKFFEYLNDFPNSITEQMLIQEEFDMYKKKIPESIVGVAITREAEKRIPKIVVKEKEITSVNLDKDNLFRIIAEVVDELAKTSTIIQPFISKHLDDIKTTIEKKYSSDEPLIIDDDNLEKTIESFLIVFKNKLFIDIIVTRVFSNYIFYDKKVNTEDVVDSVYKQVLDKYSSELDNRKLYSTNSSINNFIIERIKAFTNVTTLTKNPEKKEIYSGMQQSLQYTALEKLIINIAVSSSLIIKEQDRRNKMSNEEREELETAERVEAERLTRERDEERVRKEKEAEEVRLAKINADRIETEKKAADAEKLRIKTEREAEDEAKAEKAETNRKTKRETQRINDALILISVIDKKFFNRLIDPNNNINKRDLSTIIDDALKWIYNRKNDKDIKENIKPLIYISLEDMSLINNNLKLFKNKSMTLGELLVNIKKLIVGFIENKKTKLSDAQIDDIVDYIDYQIRPEGKIKLDYLRGNMTGGSSVEYIMNYGGGKKIPKKKTSLKRTSKKRASLKKASLKRTSKKTSKRTSKKRASLKRTSKKTSKKRASLKKASLKRTSKRTSKKRTSKRTSKKRTSKITSKKRASLKKASLKRTSKRRTSTKASLKRTSMKASLKSKSKRTSMKASLKSKSKRTSKKRYSKKI